MGDNIFQKFREKFLEEANMLLDRFEKDILELEKNPDNRGLSESVFRAMHTIKGISAMYGFEYISDYTHLLENIFQNLHDGKIGFTRDISEISLLSIDHIHRLLNDEKLEDAELRKTHTKLLQQVSAIAESGSGNPASAPEINAGAASRASGNLITYCIMINASEQMHFRGINIPGICRDLFALGSAKVIRIPSSNADESDSWAIILSSGATIDEIAEILMFIEDECTVTRISDGDMLDISSEKSVEILKSAESRKSGPTILELIDSQKPQKAERELKNTQPAETERSNIIIQKSKRLTVDTEKLDFMMFLVSQLITLNSQLNVAVRTGDTQKQTDYLEQLDTLSKQFRDTTLEMRLVPLGDLSLRFQRLVRDLSKAMGKKIELVTEGTDIELDKNTLDILAEPLMHIIRNCADHGIEDPDTRSKMGKPESGTIKLSAAYSGNHVVIRIEDDGSGIDIEKVQEKAVEKGILKGGDKPSVSDIYNILFLAGFSTARAISEVSGRGVGMDIVKKRINELRGSISIESEKGRGTAFIIKLGQSLSITDTLLFEVEASNFILPLSDIISCEQIDREEIDSRKHTSTLPYKNNLIPVVDLRSFLNLEGDYPNNSKMVIARIDDQPVAILADRILGEHQAVLKPLFRTFHDETIISTVSQLGDGKIAFLIDTNTLNRKLVG